MFLRWCLNLEADRFLAYSDVIDCSLLQRSNPPSPNGPKSFANRGVIEEDEVCSVARLLGDLVSNRALAIWRFLAGLALLQNNSQFPESYEDCMEAPAFHLQEAATFHKFAKAAYTVCLKRQSYSIDG